MGDELWCQECLLDFTDANITNRAVLQPCGHHSFCLSCLIDLEAARGIHQLKCSSCKKHVTAHKSWKKEAPSGRRTGRKRKRSNSNQDGEVIREVTVNHRYKMQKDMDAVRMWITKLMSEMSVEERVDYIGTVSYSTRCSKLSWTNSDSQVLNEQKHHHFPAHMVCIVCQRKKE